LFRGKDGVILNSVAPSPGAPILFLSRDALDLMEFVRSSS
jgi:hypothetical protein